MRQIWTEQFVGETTRLDAGRIGSDLPDDLFRLSLCALYACYFSLTPPLFAINIEVVTSPSLLDGITRLIRCGLRVQRLILPP